MRGVSETCIRRAGAVRTTRKRGTRKTSKGGAGMASIACKGGSRKISKGGAGIAGYKGGIRTISESRIGTACKRIGKTYSRGVGEICEGGVRAVSKRRIRKTCKRGIGAACE